MRNRSIPTLLIALIVGAVSLTAGLDVPDTPAYAQSGSAPYRVVGYFPSYAIYQDYYVTDIPADQLTDLIYASVDISSAGQCVSSDLWTDTQYSYPGDKPTTRLRGNFRQLQLLRGEHPNLKILFSIGGWDYSTRFSNVAATPEARTRFVRSCVSFMQQYLFDGIDIDWRYPVSGGSVPGRPEDRDNLTLLLEEFRTQLDQAGERAKQTYLLTMLAPAVPDLYDNIALDQVHPYLDWINVMSFSFQGSWSTVASHQAPLYSNTRDPRGTVVQADYNVDATVNHYLDLGIPASKLVVGIPFSGQAWQYVIEGNYVGLYESASGVPDGTRPGGILYYRDLLPLLNDPSFIQFFDEEVSVPWLYSPDQKIAISYEDPRSIRAKARYVQQNNLGGMMLWQISYDDAPHTLLSVAYSALNGSP